LCAGCPAGGAVALRRSPGDPVCNNHNHNHNYDYNNNIINNININNNNNTHNNNKHDKQDDAGTNDCYNKHAYAGTTE
jgi:hypothetical protein